MQIGWLVGLVAKSCLTLATPQTVACQAPLSIGFSRQEYGSGLPFPSPGDLPNPGIEPASSALAGRFFTTEPPGKSLSGLLQQPHTGVSISNFCPIQFFGQLNLHVCAQSFSHVQLFVTPWTLSRQVPPSVGFSRQEYWSG